VEKSNEQKENPRFLKSESGIIQETLADAIGLELID